MKLRVEGMQHARMTAQTLLEKFGVESDEHVRIEAFAQRLGLELVVTSLDGMKAQLVVGHGRAQILLSDQLADPAEQRWSIAHELGHFVLGHPSLPMPELALPRPAHRTSDCRDYEGEANRFASALLCRDHVVASICDTRPMTLDVVTRLANLCGIPWKASAMRLMETTWRTCAIVVSVAGEIRGIWPSLPFLMLCSDRIRQGQLIGPEALVRRFYDAGASGAALELVPSSAWLLGCSPEATIQEHSMAVSELGMALTMLWDASESDAPRPPEATPRLVAICRDCLLAEADEERIQA